MKTMLKRTRPEDVGISPTVLLNYLDALDQTGYIAHHIMILKQGKVAFEAHFKPFRPDVYHYLCSCSKSFASTAIGFAAAEGLLSLDDRIVDIFPEKLDGEPHQYIKALTVKHLLSMSTVSDDDRFTMRTDDWTRDYLNSEPLHYPGTIFGYDSIGTHILCEIVQKLAKSTLEEYLWPRLFEPLGVGRDELFWQLNPMGINHGGGGLHLTPEAMAKFGQLYINNGIWEGKQILPEGWAKEVAIPRRSTATSGETSRTHYGYKFWRTQRNGFACLGLAGQCIVMHPDKELVFVGAANGFQSQYQFFHMDYFWQLVYPHITDGPIPYEEDAYKQLQERANNAEVYSPGKIGGKITSDMASKVSGRYYAADKNKLNCEGFTMEFGTDSGILSLKLKEREITIPFGYGKHVPGPTGLQDYAKQKGNVFPNKCGAAGYWVDERTFVIKSHVIDSLQYFIIVCHFGEEAAVIDIRPHGIYKFDELPCAITSVCKS